MQFNDATNKNGLIQECERRCALGDAGISGTTQTLREFTARINNAGSIIWSKIFQSNGGWIYDDSNHTDLPQAATNLVSGTAKYGLDSDALTIQRVDVKDNAGNWLQLKPITQSEIDDQGIEEFESSNGTPRFYRLVGRTIELFPAPDYNSTGGLKALFDRDGVSFDYDDTTATPGFASPYHYLLAVKASLDYLIDKDTRPNTRAELRAEWLQGLSDLQDFHSKRFIDLPTRLRSQNRLKSWR